MENRNWKIPIMDAAVICMCFLLTSTGYLAWVYHLMELVPPKVSDGLTMVGAYTMQAVGIGGFSLLIRRESAFAGRAFLAGLALHLLCMFPALHAAALVWTLVFGYVMNLFCGMIAGYYLWRLAGRVQPECCARTLGAGYSIAILASWLLYLAGGRNVYRGDLVPALCLVLSAAAAAMAFLSPPVPVFFARQIDSGRQASAERAGFRDAASGTALGIVTNTGAGTAAHSGAGTVSRTGLKKIADTPSKMETETGPAAINTGAAGEKGLSLLPSVCILVLLFSIINSCGFSFPAADLAKGISLEFSRLFYAAGLLIAGFVNDKNRRYGAVCALAALVFPFIMLSLQREAASVRFFWAASYFTFGFYTVYRIILLVDIARGTQKPELSGCGLLVGRIGDAAGEAVCLAFFANHWLLAGIPAVLFVAAVVVFLRLYPLFYAPSALVSVYKGAIAGSGDGMNASPGVSAFAVSTVPALESLSPADRSAGQMQDHGAERRELSVGSVSVKPAFPGTVVPGSDRAGQDTVLHTKPVRDDREVFHRFCGKYELSAREREVLRLLLKERSNVEIADELSISAGTVKYHIHNLLQKTGCRNRLVLLTLYYSETE